MLRKSVGQGIERLFTEQRLAPQDEQKLYKQAIKTAQTFMRALQYIFRIEFEVLGRIPKPQAEQANAIHEINVLCEDGFLTDETFAMACARFANPAIY